ncbi:hypothetical protein UP10_32585 [Bradyrhizobium sp. LTSPM299]|nr:hypothetical protein UP10_32585 [Bradyrhizobium sp. LTSPM299]
MAMIVRMAGIPVKELLDYVFSRAVDIDRGSGNGLPPILLVAADGEPSYRIGRAVKPHGFPAEPSSHGQESLPW